MTVEYDIGTDVRCCVGDCGQLRRVVVDPVAEAVTHLVVEPRHRRGEGHLVPINVVASTQVGIELSCTGAEFEALHAAEESHFLPGADGSWGYHQDQMLTFLLGRGQRRYG